MQNVTENCYFCSRFLAFMYLAPKAQMSVAPKPMSSIEKPAFSLSLIHISIERTAVFNGVYHVLGGVLAPMEGVGPGDLRIAELMARLGREDVTEVVLAMNPNIEGETTAAYLARLIKPLGVKVTRPASCLLYTSRCV